MIDNGPHATTDAIGEGQLAVEAATTFGSSVPSYGNGRLFGRRRERAAAELDAPGCNGQHRLLICTRFVRRAGVPNKVDPVEAHIIGVDQQSAFGNIDESPLARRGSYPLAGLQRDFLRLTGRPAGRIRSFIKAASNGSVAAVGLTRGSSVASRLAMGRNAAGDSAGSDFDTSTPASTGSSRSALAGADTTSSAGRFPRRVCQTTTPVIHIINSAMVTVAWRLRSARRVRRPARAGCHSHAWPAKQRERIAAPPRAAGPSKSRSSANETGRPAGSRWVQRSTARSNTSGTSAASCRTSTSFAACTAFSLVKLFPPGNGARPVNKCHHTQPHA